MTLREVILDEVNHRPGIKSIDLVVAVMRAMSDNDDLFSHRDYTRTIESLVQEGELIEIEYTLPNMMYRIKSIYFPKDTKVALGNGESFDEEKE